MNNKTTERLLAATQDIWEGYLNHPFVHGIADGSLDIQKFRFYLLQDYVYLFDYAKVFAQGVVKSRDPEIMRVFATSVANILGGEMNIHRGYMSRLGITEAEAERVKPSLNNESYTSYMRAVAAEEGPAEIMAAVLSCALSYEYIASGSSPTTRTPISMSSTVNGCRATHPRTMRQKTASWSLIWSV